MRSKPKKSLGQNFLVDKNIQRKIIAACELSATDVVLEIGAGRGELTRLIAPLVLEAFALEIDSSLCEATKEDLRAFTNIKVINTDVLKFDLHKYFNKITKKIKIVGNVPYYISTPIIEHLFKFKDVIGTVFLTLQKEFAQRMVAKPGSKVYGSFSCFVQYFSRPKILFSIKNNSFYPVPKVDSSFVSLDLTKDIILPGPEERLLFKIIRGSFNKRRKTLRNSLEGIIPQDKLQEFFETSQLLANTRPEDLSLKDFIILTIISFHA